MTQTETSVTGGTKTVHLAEIRSSANSVAGTASTVVASAASASSADTSVDASADAAAVSACRNFELANPNPDQWNKFSVDAWWALFRETTVRGYQAPNNISTISWIIADHARRDHNGLQCFANTAGVCGLGVGDCRDWLDSARDQSPAGLADAARAYVWYRGYANLGKLISYITAGTDFSASTVSSELINIGTTFLAKPVPPGSQWDRYMAGIGPAMGAIGGVLGLAGRGAPGAAFSGFGNMISSLANSFSAATAKAGDARIDALSDLSGSFTTLWQTVHNGMTDVFAQVMTYDNGTGNQYYSLADILYGGLWLEVTIANNLDNGTITKSVQDGTVKFFEYGSINALWRTQDVFIVFVPYNRKIKYQGSHDHNPKWWDHFSKQNCLDYLGTTNWLKTGSCEGDGMTFVIGDVDANLQAEEIMPPGGDNWHVFVGGNLTTADILASSVGGWQRHGFDSNVSSPVYDALIGNAGASFRNSTVADMTVFNGLKPSTEGFFNVPVCVMYDIVSIYGQGIFAGEMELTPMYSCACLSDRADSPAKPEQRFRDFVSSGLKSRMLRTDSLYRDCYLGD